MSTRDAKRAARAAKDPMAGFATRYVALTLMYHGEAFSGFAASDTTDSEETSSVESACGLIRDRYSCGYSRAGRTDRGVSALGQVVALRLRSRVREGTPPPAAPSGDGLCAHAQPFAPEHYSRAGMV